mgnify:CR=1 FL=1
MKISFGSNLFQRAIWNWKQPLTVRPDRLEDSVSDLFVWRSSSDWQTFFELIDIPSLFDDKCDSKYVNFVFFNTTGQLVFEQRIALQANKRQMLNVSSIIGQSYGELGTFAVFHESPPSDITQMDAHLAERGYVSYCYQNAPLKSYVHGNLDAISRTDIGALQLLGGVSFLRREYHLQHKIELGVVYEFGLVNPSPQRQRFLCKLISTSSKREIGLYEFELDAGGVRLFTMQAKDSSDAKLIIQSRLVMARPVVFRFQNHIMDVFHG